MGVGRKCLEYREWILQHDVGEWQFLAIEADFVYGLLTTRGTHFLKKIFG